MAELAGVGIRLVEVPRFRAAVERFGDRLLGRVFTPDEIAYGARKRHGAQNLAARFAAKCAGRSLLLEHAGRRVRLVEIEVVRRPSGEPTLRVVGHDPAHGDEDPADLDLCMRVSLTHDAHFAVASVWLEKGAAAGVS